MIIQEQNSPNNPCWVILDEPYEKDAEHGIILSSGLGYNFKKTWKLCGADEPYIIALNMDTDRSYVPETDYPLFLAKIHQYQPKIIVTLGDELLNKFVPSTRQKTLKASSLTKWAGSLLSSPDITYPHYIIGTYDPAYLSANWDYHEIMGYIDLGHVKEELDFIRTNGIVQTLPARSVITNPTYEQVCDYLRYIISAYDAKRISHVSSDIETIRPRKGTLFHSLGHCGYTYTISLAPSTKEAISFCLWDYTIEQTIVIWRLLNEVLQKIPQIGQNYFSFDTHHLEALGYSPELSIVSDTLIRHHILWPGLPHKLQFQTKQYTREPYYKDEGKNWTSKQKHQLMRYNCLDTMVTFEIYLAQEIEFDDRPYLR